MIQMSPVGLIVVTTNNLKEKQPGRKENVTKCVYCIKELLFYSSMYLGPVVNTTIT